MTYVERVRLLEPNYHRRILYGKDGNEPIRNKIAPGHVLMVARLGSAELACIQAYLRDRSKDPSREYPVGIGLHMSRNAGFFPADARSLDRFSGLFLDAVESTDVMAVWTRPSESETPEKHSAVEDGCYW